MAKQDIAIRAECRADKVERYLRTVMPIAKKKVAVIAIVILKGVYVTKLLSTIPAAPIT
ncbi:hypothetical protein D3C86_1233440 [compost metagenome]